MHEQTTYRFIIQEAYGEWNIMSGNHPNGGWTAWAKKGALLKRDPLEEPGEVFFEFGFGRQETIDLLIKNHLEDFPMYDPGHYTDGLDRQKNPIERLGLRHVVIGLLLFWCAVAWWFW